MSNLPPELNEDIDEIDLFEDRKGENGASTNEAEADANTTEIETENEPVHPKSITGASLESAADSHDDSATKTEKRATRERKAEEEIMATTGARRSSRVKK